MVHKRMRRLLMAGGMLCAAALAAPQLAFGAGTPPASKPPAREITVTITDTGFDQSSYSVGNSWIAGNDEAGKTTFVNKGTRVHTANAVSGSYNDGVTFGSRTDAQGNSSPCWANLGATHCGAMGGLTTGGIDPGGSVTLAFAQAPATYTITSATDCLFGNSTPGFDCGPVTIKTVKLAPLSALSGTLPGSVVRPGGSSDCVAGMLAVTPDVGPAFCFSTVRDPGNLKGSPKAPLGDTTVSITDFGFDPAVVYVKPGSTVTWINNGQRVHSVQQKPVWAYPVDGLHQLQSGGLAPGQSYSYAFPAGVSANYESAQSLDIVPKNQNGNFGCPPFMTKSYLCNPSIMIGAVRVAG